MQRLPNHWVGISPKRELPLAGPVASGPPCATCRERAVDDGYLLLEGNASKTETVYCAKHGWAFPTAEVEHQFTCSDHNDGRT